MTEQASATITFTQQGLTTYEYDLTLNDTGTTTLGTFWFSWVPGAGYLDVAPSSEASPAGWNVALTDGGESIQWVAAASGDDVQSHASLGGFSFISTETPAQLFASSTVHPGQSQLTSFVYTGAPFSDPGFEFEVACFHAGTRILTSRGPVAVEDLAVGDHVATLLGRGLVPVRWLGHRSIDCTRHPRPDDVWPIRVCEGAFGPGAPIRDLLLSPDHAVHVDGRLIPIRHLVNGATIVRAPKDRAAYWHVELAAHDVLLAEGLACESYLDTGNRAAFANGGGATAAHPDFALRVWQTRACAELVCGGPALTAVKARLLRRSMALGHAAEADPGVHLLAGGRAVPGEADGPRYDFRLPDGTGEVRLVSRTAIPAELRADSADRRRLGVAVTRLALDGVEFALADRRCGAGWLDPEGGEVPWRWTDGCATLDCGGASRLEVTILPMLTYWRAPPLAASDDRAAC